MKTTMIEAKRLTKAYGIRRALQGLDLSVSEGELVALVGQNGAGKSTATRMLCGQLVPDSGTALIGGLDVYSDPLAARTLLGCVTQDQTLPPKLTLHETADFVCSLRDLPLSATAYDRLVVAAGLADDADRLIGELSLGSQRKAAWVIGLVARPKALILDEALAGLDAASTVKLIEEVYLCLDRVGLSVLWVEHDLSPIVDRVDRVIVLREGRVSLTIDGAELRRSSNDEELNALMQQWTQAN